MTIEKRRELIIKTEEEERSRLEAADRYVKELREAARAKRFEAEYPVARKRQAILLEELRDFGVLGMVEEFVGKPILPLTDRAGKYIKREPTDAELKRLSDSSLRSIGGGLRSGEWSVNVADVYMGEDGEVNSDLHIKMVQHGLRAFGREPRDIVLITYSRDRMLVIFGEKTTFFDPLSRESDPETMERIEQAIAEACVHPEKGELKDYEGRVRGRGDIMG